MGNNLSQFQQQQMIPEELDLVEVKEVEIDNQIIRERNEGLHDLNERLGDLKYDPYLLSLAYLSPSLLGSVSF